jgi:anti-sigma regulatory factor (Ser/Thr protein kinase)
MVELAQFARGDTALPRTRRDQVIAAALRTLLRTLHPSTCTAYLVADGRRLVPAVTVDTPLSFTVSPGMRLDDEANATSRAYLTDDMVFLDWPAMQRLTQRSPEVLLHVPVPMVVASVPISTPGHRLGVLTLRWELSDGGGLIGADTLERLAAAGRALGVELADLAEQGEPMDAPVVPLFVDRRAEHPPDGAAVRDPVASRGDRRGASREHGRSGHSASGTSFLYQVRRLAAELTATEHVQDVVAAAQTQVIRAFGGRAVMLCLAENERLHVLGAAGFTRDAVGRVDGVPIKRRTPETDAISLVQVLYFRTAADLLREYPGADPDPDFHSRAYFPLISQGRAVGCCVVEFTAEAPPLTAEETAVVMLMLEEVGQSLERSRAHEVEQALARTVQRGLLPRSLPHLTEADATARYLPAAEETQVGGDWYDLIPLPGGGAGLVIGDVEGHAVEAAGIMGQLRSAVRAYAAEGHDPASVLERSNRLFAELGSDRYATCCCMWVDLATGTACVATAGHHAPLISDEHSRTRRVDIPVGPPLGVAPRSVYRNSEVTLSPGSLVTLFTDGMLDSRRLGTSAALTRLAGLVADDGRTNLEVLADRLVRESRPERVLDDAALLLLRYDGPHTAGPPRVARISVQRHDLQGVGRVRRFLDDMLERWGLRRLRDDLDLLATEVVTNALIHAHSEVEVRVRGYPDRIRVDVRDSDPHPPVPAAILTADAAGNQAAESGRGLLIVEMLAAAWGSSPSGRGKTTWFDVAVPPDPDRRQSSAAGS